MNGSNGMNIDGILGVMERWTRRLGGNMMKEGWIVGCWMMSMRYVGWSGRKKKREVRLCTIWRWIVDGAWYTPKIHKFPGRQNDTWYKNVGQMDRELDADDVMASFFPPLLTLTQIISWPPNSKIHSPLTDQPWTIKRALTLCQSDNPFKPLPIKDHSLWFSSLKESRKPWQCIIGRVRRTRLNQNNTIVVLSTSCWVLISG